MLTGNRLRDPLVNPAWQSTACLLKDQVSQLVYEGGTSLAWIANQVLEVDDGDPLAGQGDSGNPAWNGICTEGLQCRVETMVPSNKNQQRTTSGV